MADDRVISREGPRSLSVLLAGMRDEGDESVNDEASEKLQGLVAKLREASAVAAAHSADSTAPAALGLASS